MHCFLKRAPQIVSASGLTTCICVCQRHWGDRRNCLLPHPPPSFRPSASLTNQPRCLPPLWWIWQTGQSSGLPDGAGAAWIRAGLDKEMSLCFLFVFTACFLSSHLHASSLRGTDQAHQPASCWTFLPRHPLCSSALFLSPILASWSQTLSSLGHHGPKSLLSLHCI